MRAKLDPQDPLDFCPPRLKVTRDYHEKYSAVDRILAETPEILHVFHRHVSKTLSKASSRRRATFTSDQRDPFAAPAVRGPRSTHSMTIHNACR